MLYYTWGSDDTSLFYTQFSEDPDKKYVLFRYDTGRKQSQEILKLSYDYRFHAIPGNRRLLLKNDLGFYVLDVEKKSNTHAFNLPNDVFPKTGKYDDVNQFMPLNETTVVLELAGDRVIPATGKQTDDYNDKTYDVMSYDYSTDIVRYIVKGSFRSTFANDGSGIYYYHPVKKNAYYYSAITGMTIKLPSQFSKNTHIEYLNKDILLFSLGVGFRLQDQKIIRCPSSIPQKFSGELSPAMKYMTREFMGTDAPWELFEPALTILKTNESLYKWLIDNCKI